MTARVFPDEAVVSVDLSTWQETGDDGNGSDPKSRLLGTLTINGVRHHIEAIQVEEDADGIQNAASPAWASYFDELYTAFGGDGAMQTVEFNGRSYALFVSPYC